MNRIKTFVSTILEGVLFSSFGISFLFICLYLFDYFTSKSISNIDIDITPTYKYIAFPFVFYALLVSFILGKVVFNSLKKTNLQWFYNLIFFITAAIFVKIYLFYIIFQEMQTSGSEPKIDEIFQQIEFQFQLDAVIIIILNIFSFSYQLIKSHTFSKTKTVC